MFVLNNITNKSNKYISNNKICLKYRGAYQIFGNTANLDNSRKKYKIIDKKLIVR